MASSLSATGGEMGALLGNYALFAIATIAIGLLIISTIRHRKG
jgi:hypothetical protein